MNVINDLKQILRRIDGKGYKAYKDLENSFEFPGFTMHLDHVQGDPFAAPSAIRVRIPLGETSVPESVLQSPELILATEDYLTRLFQRNTQKICRGIRGTGNSGQISIQQCGQEILKRSSAVLTPDFLEFRFYAALPARGRSVLGAVAEVMLLKEIPDIVQLSCRFDRTIQNQLVLHAHTFVDFRHIQNSLEGLGLVAFVPNGAVLPRRSGIDDRPLKAPEETVIPFRAPEGLEVRIQTPHSGTVSGMGIPRGVTVIAGGGFHGKSTLLNALMRSVYGHIPMDGREQVAARQNAVKIRAEDGRSIRQVNISPFIRELPYSKDTTSFTTENASGSTSQAANIMEALEAGASVLLIDEDTSATNFMIRDERMRHVVRKEPITPLIDVIRSLYADHGVSSILVTGGAGDYFSVADTVILMEDYLPYNVTESATAGTTSSDHPLQLPDFGKRKLKLPSAFKGRREKFAARGTDSLLIGKNTVDVRAVEQIVETSQAEGIAFLLKQYQEATAQSNKPMVEIVRQIHQRFSSTGFQFLKRGNLSVPRELEVIFTINRVREASTMPESDGRNAAAGDDESSQADQ